MHFKYTSSVWTRTNRIRIAKLHSFILSLSISVSVYLSICVHVNFFISSYPYLCLLYICISLCLSVFFCFYYFLLYLLLCLSLCLTPSLLFSLKTTAQGDLQKVSWLQICMWHNHIQLRHWWRDLNINQICVVKGFSKHLSLIYLWYDKNKTQN